ncbi:MAG: hypothetical protein V3V78_02400 [Candidatus Woesearchaeota archaeon]
MGLVMRGDLKLPSPKTYLEEAKEFDPEEEHFPIANREDDISALLRRIAYSRYPNFAILGSPGIGKTMAIDYIVELLTGKQDVSEDHEWAPLVQKIRERAKEYQKRDFLFLPNMQNPFEPTVIDYLNDEVGDAEDKASTFCRELTGFFQQITQREEVYPTFEEEEFKDFVDDSLHNIYQTLYTELALITPHPAEFNVQLTSFGKYRLYTKFIENKVPLADIKRSLYIKKSSPQNTKAKLGRRLRREVDNPILDLFKESSDIRVVGLDDKEKIGVLKEAFDKIHEEYSGLTPLFRKNGIEYFRQLQYKKREGIRSLYMSDESIEWSIHQLEDILKRHTEEADPRLAEWMDFAVKYFTNNQDELSSMVLDHYKRINEISREKSPNRVDLMSGALTLTLDHRRNDNMRFVIKHGKHNMNLDNVLQTKIYTQSSEGGELCVRHPTDITKKVLLGEVIDDGTEEEDEGEWFNRRSRKIQSTHSTPPHLKFKPGYLVDSSVLVMPDNLNAFFKAVIGTEEKDSEARRQIILTYFQSGDLVYQERGITFKIHCPTIVMGSDNDFPFYKSSLGKKDENDPDEAMASRFVVSLWEDYIPNTEQTRKGTMSVAYNAADGFKKDSGLEVKLTPEAIDWFLGSNIIEDTLSLEYRDLDSHIREVLGWAGSKGIDKISLKTIKEYKKNNDTKNRFALVNSRFESMIQPPPAKISGAINGVTILLDGDMKSDLFPVRSKLIQDRPRGNIPNFRAYDAQAEMISSSTKKGYDEAVDFIKSQIEEPLRFLMNTSFHENVRQVVGNSASLAIALSLWSSITGEEIYQDRVFTGTVSFFDGSVGGIGGVYHKGLAVWKWNELMNNGGYDCNPIFVYPAENYRELAKEVITSPYSLDDITMIPVTNFQEALYLATTDKITKNTFKSLPDKAGKHFEESQGKLVDKIKEVNEKVDKVYSK